MNTKPTGEPEIDGNAFSVVIRMHTDDAQKVLDHEERVRFLIGAAFDACELQEEIDYTLEVHRVYKGGS